MSRLLFCALSAVSFFIAPSLYADQVVNMYRLDTDGQLQSIGTITLSKTSCGVLLTPNLHDLPEGVHGFHVHEKPSCADKGMAAGGHLDPKKSNHHEGPYKKGHLGDLPILVVDSEGKSTLPMLAPHLTLADFKNHALMIHEHGDNYSDEPEKLGGGAGRIACGVIAK